MDFGIRRMHRLILKHGTLKLLLTIYFTIGALNISEIQTKNNLIHTLNKNFIFNFKIYKKLSYIVSFVDFPSTKFMLASASFSHTKHFHYFLCSSLSRLKAFSACHKLVPISYAQNLSFGFI